MTILFITGTDTDAGKTVLATLLTQWLRASGVRVAALKPLCSGRRADAAALRAAAGQVLPLDTVNPWHFRAPLAPVLAARRERQQVRLAEVVEHIRRVSRGFEVVVVEGAVDCLVRSVRILLPRTHPRTEGHADCCRNRLGR